MTRLVSYQSQDRLGNTPTLLYPTTISVLVCYQSYTVPYVNVRLCCILLTLLGFWHMAFSRILNETYLIPSPIRLNDLCVLNTRSVKPDFQASLLVRCLVLNCKTRVQFFNRNLAITKALNKAL